VSDDAAWMRGTREKSVIRQETIIDVNTLSSMEGPQQPDKFRLSFFWCAFVNGLTHCCDFAADNSEYARCLVVGL
jgi:hypothetical protein